MKRILTLVILSLLLLGEGIVVLAMLTLLLVPHQADIGPRDSYAIGIPAVLGALSSVWGIIEAARGRSGVLPAAVMIKLTLFAGMLACMVTITPPFVPGATVTMILLTLLVGAAAVQELYRAGELVQAFSEEGALFYVPPCIRASMQECFEMTDALERLGRADHETCTPYFTQGCAVPRGVLIEAKQAERRVFSQWLPIL